MEHREVTTYNVGQGLFNLVQIKTDRKPPGNCLFCGIFDCGTISNPYGSKQKILQDAAEKINGAEVECIVISHQDKDHWSYLIELLQKVYNFAFQKDTWYKERKQNAYLRLCLSQKYIMVERYLATYYILRPYPKVQYTCTYIETNGNTTALTRIEDENEGTINWTIKSEWKDSVNFELSISAEKYETDINYTSIKMVQLFTEAECLKRISESGIIRKIIVYFDKFADCKWVNPDTASQMRDTTLKLWYRAAKVTTVEEAEYLTDQYIDKIFLGGAEWGIGYTGLKNFLELLGNVFLKDSAVLLIENHKYRCFPITIQEDISSNSRQDYSDIAIKRNATSLVSCYIDLDNHQLLFPGDATIHTFGYLKEKWHRMVGNSNLEFMIAPHHGSYKTNVLLLDTGEAASEEWQPVKEFFRRFGPQTVTISAYHEEFGHPHIDVAKFMAEYAAEDGKHGILVCKSLDNYDDADIVPCETSIYCTEVSGNIFYRDGTVTVEVQEKSEARVRMGFLPPDDLFIRIDGVKL